MLKTPEYLAAQDEVRRDNILAILCEAPSVGFTKLAITRQLASLHTSIAAKQLNEDLDYLSDRALATVVDKSAVSILRRYRATADGRDYCLAKGLSQ